MSDTRIPPYTFRHGFNFKTLISDLSRSRLAWTKQRRIGKSFRLLRLMTSQFWATTRMTSHIWATTRMTSHIWATTRMTSHIWSTRMTSHIWATTTMTLHFWPTTRMTSHFWPTTRSRLQLLVNNVKNILTSFYYIIITCYTYEITSESEIYPFCFELVSSAEMKAT